MSSAITAAAFASAASHPLPEGRVFGYGTAGFRTDASILDGILYRVGVLAALRARQVKQYVGVMLTASHNPHQDNGVKIIDNNGEMLDHHWEPYATQIANARTAEDLAVVVNEIITNESIDMSSATAAFRVIVARDTRPSGAPLRDSCQDGIKDLGQAMIDVGLTTTPEAHFLVMKANEGVVDPENKEQVSRSYIDHLTAAFKRFTFGSAEREQNLNVTLIIDCANGVGTLRFPQLQDNLKQVFQFDGRNMRLEEPTLLNDKSGADFVQKELVSPTCISAEDSQKAPQPQRRFLHFVSWDGDVDRVVFFFFDDQGHFQLVDGDKMLTLFASFFKQQFDALAGVLDSSLTIGTVQTAYANGGSTQYITDTLKIPVSFCPTGVKFLHHKAKEYDVGVYFEANGHGTVLFSDKFRGAVKQALEHPGLTDEQRTAALRLQGASELLHPTVGDAIADMLAIEGCLALLEWDLEKWNACYSDLPSRQLKAAVPDPKVVKTVWDETRVLEPAELQNDIDALVTKYANARAFVRPSGTEPIVRVYAEAASRAEADVLAQEVQSAIVRRLV